jgi:hypothetical protein
MPHFTMGIIIPANVTDINAFVDRQIEPYNCGFPSSNCDGHRLIKRSDRWVTGTGEWLSGVRNTGRFGRDTYSTDQDVIDNAFPTTEHALANGIIPHAIITANGKWRDHYNIWGPADYQDDFAAWNKTARRILRRHAGHRMLILVTCN